MYAIAARLRKGVWLTVLLTAAVLACSDHTLAPDDTEALDASVGEGGARDSGVPDSGERDGGVRDAGPRDARVDDEDAGDVISHGDAGSDGGPVCDVARCPVPAGEPLKRSGGQSDVPDLELRGCCIDEDDNGGSWRELDGQCGIKFPGSQDIYELICQPLIEGELDETCLDTIVDGEVVQGCRRTDGWCGHLTPGWGCHQYYRSFWDLDTRDDRDSTLPNPFNCTPATERCTRNSQCCAHHNYGRLCSPVNDLGDGEGPGDAGTDGGLAPGYCSWAGPYNDPESTPYPD